jgi:hypothetical protein
MTSMIESGAALTLIAALVLGPIAWRAVHDRRAERALDVSARVRHVIDRVLGGESLVAVRAVPATLTRQGRVVLSVPADWRWLLRPAWERVLAAIPAGYELVVQQRDAPTHPAAASLEERKAAA